MAPSNDDRIELLFSQALAMFDSLKDIQMGVSALSSTEEFARIYQDLEFPSHFDHYNPVKSGDLVNSSIDQDLSTKVFHHVYKHSNENTNPLKHCFQLLREAEESGDKDKQQSLKKLIYTTVVSLRCWIIGYICSLIHRQGIPDLLQRVGDGDSEVLINLVELDAAFLTHECAQPLIRKAALAGDRNFLAKLSRILNPNRKTKAIESKRNEYALRFLDSFGFRERKDSEWCDVMTRHGFEIYSDAKNLAKARERLGISKQVHKKPPPQKSDK